VRANLFDTFDGHYMVKNYLSILFGQFVILNTFESIYKRRYLFKKRVIRLKRVFLIKLGMLMSGNKN